MYKNIVQCLPDSELYKNAEGLRRRSMCTAQHTNPPDIYTLYVYKSHHSLTKCKYVFFSVCQFHTDKISFEWEAKVQFSCYSKQWLEEPQQVQKMNVHPIFSLLYISLSSLPTLRVHQHVSNCVCLLFGARRTEGFIAVGPIRPSSCCSWKQHWWEQRERESKQQSCRPSKENSCKIFNRSVELRETLIIKFTFLLWATPTTVDGFVALWSLFASCWLVGFVPLGSLYMSLWPFASILYWAVSLSHHTYFIQSVWLRGPQTSWFPGP